MVTDEGYIELLDFLCFDIWQKFTAQTNVSSPISRIGYMYVDNFNGDGTDPCTIIYWPKANNPHSTPPRATTAYSPTYWCFRYSSQVPHLEMWGERKKADKLLLLCGLLTYVTPSIGCLYKQINFPVTNTMHQSGSYENDEPTTKREYFISKTPLGWLWRGKGGKTWSLDIATSRSSRLTAFFRIGQGR